MVEDASITPWRLAWRAKGAALQAALTPFALMAVLYVGLDRIEGALRHIIGGAWLAVYEALFTGLDALLIGTLLEALHAGRPHWLPSRRAIGFALAFVPLGAVLSALHFFLRVTLNDDLGKGGPAPALWKVVLFQHPMQWLVLGLAVAPLARRLLKLPTQPTIAPASDGRPAFDSLVVVLLIAALLASSLGLGLRAVLPSPDTLWGAFPGVDPASAAGHVSALFSWYAATYIVTLLVAVAVAVPLGRPARTASQST